MSYFNGLKLTKKGEQLQAQVNGNLSKTLTFTRAKLGSGEISSEDEIRFLTNLKEEWGEASISNCTIKDETKVAIELQFSNQNLSEDKIFRELALFAKTEDENEVLFAYANAGEKYDYIPLLKDSPHTFIITIHFTISSSAKVNALIDFNSYVRLETFEEAMKRKVNKTDVATIQQIRNMFSDEFIEETYSLAENLDIRNLFAGTSLSGGARFDLSTLKAREEKIVNMRLLSLFNDLIQQRMNSDLDALSNDTESKINNLIRLLNELSSREATDIRNLNNNIEQLSYSVATVSQIRELLKKGRS